MAIFDQRNIIVLFYFFPLKVLAFEWYALPSVLFRTEYNDNLLLMSGNIPESFGIQTTLTGTSGIRSPLTNIAISAQGDIYRYWGQDNLDRNNWKIGLDASYTLNGKSQLGFNAGYISDTSLTSEILTSGLLAGSFSGRQVGRKSINLMPSWSYSLSRTSLINLNYEHQESSYDVSQEDRLSNSFKDYHTDSVNLSFKNNLSANTRYTLSFNALDYSLQDYDTKNYSLTATIDHDFTKNLSFNMFAGIRKTDTEATVQKIAQINNELKIVSQQSTNTSYGPLFGVGMKKKFMKDDISINYLRSTNPSGIGFFLISDSFNLSANHEFTKILKLLVSGSVILTTATSSGQNDSNFDRTYYTIGPTLTWDLSKHFSLNGGYRYQMQQYNTSNNSEASSNNLFIYISYHSDEISTNHLFNN